MPNFVKVAAAGDVPPGTGKCVEAGGKQIALFNVGGAFHAIDNTCLHRGGPSERVEKYDVKVEDEAVLVAV